MVFRPVVFFVAVAIPEQGFAVVGESLEFPLRGVDVAFVVAESGVEAGARGGGDVLFFDAHLVELGVLSVDKILAESEVDGGNDVPIHWPLLMIVLLIVQLISGVRRRVL